MRHIYLDYAAATPLDPEVLSTMGPYLGRQFYNPSAMYLAAKAVKKDLEAARVSVAGLLGSKPSEVVFTAGATEANNLAVQGVMRQFPEAEMLVSAIEHESVHGPAEIYKSKNIPVSAKGIVDLLALEKLITDKTLLVSVMLVNNELGTVQPIRDIAKLLNKLSNLRKAQGNRLPLYLHTDAAQAPLYLDLHVSKLGVDLLTLNGGKMYGPKQSGVLFVKTGTQITPLILGGGQEWHLRSGTENMAGIIGFAKAFGCAQQDRNEETQRLAALRDLFVTQLEKNVQGITINGSTKHCAPHIISATFNGLDNERLMMELDEAGIQAATGSACSASNDKPSYVLSAIGLTDKAARSTIRFSLGKSTDEASLNQVIKKLVGLTASNR